MIYIYCICLIMFTIMQHEIKTGFVFLHSCDRCSSHEPIIELCQKVILMVNDLLQILQPGPNIPPSSEDYTGNYSIGDQVRK